MVSSKKESVKWVRVDNYEVAVVEVTPRIAAQILERNGGNRKVKQRNLSRLQAAIRAGEWEVNGATIVLTESGELLDGQHRLEAVVAEATTIRTFMVRGVSSDAFPVIDTGARRSGSDTLYIDGVSYPTETSAAAHLIHKYLRYGSLLATGHVTDPSNKEIQALIREYPDINESVEFIANLRLNAKSWYLPSSVGSALHYLFKLINRTQSDNFFEKTRTAEYISSSDPRFKLRDALQNSKVVAGLKSKRDKRWLMGITIKAWNTFIAGKETKSLRYSLKNEGFPEINQVITLEDNPFLVNKPIFKGVG